MNGLCDERIRTTTQQKETKTKKVTAKTERKVKEKKQKRNATERKWNDLKRHSSVNDRIVELLFDKDET